MCDPLTMIGLALGAVGSFMGSSQKAADPPAAAPVQASAIAAPTSRTPGATVRLGNASDDIQNDLNPDNSTPNSGFVEQRIAGNSLGNLGRSGLAL